MSRKITIFLVVIIIITISLVIPRLSNNLGQVVTPNNSITFILTEQNEPVIWENLKITIGQQDGPGNYVSIPNHSEITDEESINLPIGEAKLIRFLHGGSAVNPVPDKVIYWIYIQKSIQGKPEMMRTYYVEGEVIGNNEQQARQNLIELAQAWKVE
ncbi:hypothetical protein [Paenibacillus brevis]|uniref:Uncharacterized protein n=1 Tax=Paenibacillus brevis TaxID=2841508 RepID=A0ABS6FPI9_9BACL|nr:hypothetical protein [Paenibacillus brevis]MBU5672127.1 hypothetical protein [Paenibacillus brevis]